MSVDLNQIYDVTFTFNVTDMRVFSSSPINIRYVRINTLLDCASKLNLVSMEFPCGLCFQKLDFVD